MFDYKNAAWIISGILFVYWIVLLFVYEKEKKIVLDNYSMYTDEELFKKYPPLIAGCIEGNRDVVHSDIIATIFDMINKKVINLELEPINEEKTFYKYNLIRNRKVEFNYEMDEIHAFVHRLLFGEAGFDREKIDLKTFVEELSNMKDYPKIIKELQKIATKKLHKMGANKNKVPKLIRIFNIILFSSTLLFSIYILISSIIHINFGTMDMLLIYFAIMLFGFLMPIIIFVLYATVLMYIQGKVLVNRFIEKFANKGVSKILVITVLALITTIIITLEFSVTPAFIPYEIMLSLAFLIMKTDNLMIQNDEELLLDYNRLKKMKETLREYSLLNKREIEDVKLWEQYMTYAIAFGVAKKAIYRTDTKLQKVSIDKGYLLDLALDTVEGFVEVNF